MARRGLIVIGGLLVAFGTIWTSQGLGLLDWPPGSAMLDRREWAVRGAIAAMIGAGLLVAVARASR